MIGAKSYRSQGFTLLEALLALFVFSLAVVALVEAINAMGSATVEARLEQKVQERLETLLLELTRKQDWLKDGPLTSIWKDEVKEPPLAYAITVEPMKLINKENQPLSDLFKIRVKAQWSENGKPVEEEIETWVWTPLYEVRKSK